MISDESTTQDTTSPPRWHRLVDGLDQALTPPANRLVRTNLFADTVTAMTRLESMVRRLSEAQATWVLHLAHLPATRDVRKIRAQLNSIEARMVDLAERLDEREA